MTDIVDVMRAKAAGGRNVVGDVWEDSWCASAADEIERLRSEVARLRYIAREVEMFDAKEPSE